MMNNDANIGDIHLFSSPPNGSQNSHTKIIEIRIGTIVILKLKRNRTNHGESFFSSGNLVSFLIISRLDNPAIIVYDIARDRNAIATKTSCESTKNKRIIEISAIIAMCGNVLGESILLIR